MGKPDYYRIGVVGKTFEIMEALARQPKWELANLSRTVGMPKTTVHRILLTLLDLGYVFQETGSSAYGLSFKLLKLGSQVTAHMDIIDIARPYCRTLLQTLGETVYLNVPLGTEMIVVDKQVTTHLLRQDSMIGGSFPMFRSASGKVCLAFQEELSARHLLERIMGESLGKITMHDIEEMWEELSDVRQNLTAFDNEEIYIGVRCVAVPIFDFKGDFLAVLSTSAPSVRFVPTKLEMVAKELRKTAEQISLRFGATSYPPLNMNAEATMPTKVPRQTIV